MKIYGDYIPTKVGISLPQIRLISGVRLDKEMRRIFFGKRRRPSPFHFHRVYVDIIQIQKKAILVGFFPVRNNSH
jgi:hypothetical protein